MKRRVSGEEGRSASARVLKAVDNLTGVGVTDLECHARKAAPDEMLLTVELRATGTVHDDVIQTRSEYLVTAVDNEDEPTDDNTVWVIRVRLMAQWERRPGIDVKQADIQCFAMGQGALTCHPYAREVIQSAAARMNYPPVTLDLIFNPWIGPDGVEIEMPDDSLELTTAGSEID